MSNANNYKFNGPNSTSKNLAPIIRKVSPAAGIGGNMDYSNASDLQRTTNSGQGVPLKKSDLKSRGSSRTNGVMNIAGQSTLVSTEVGPITKIPVR